MGFCHTLLSCILSCESGNAPSQCCRVPKTTTCGDDYFVPEPPDADPAASGLGFKVYELSTLM
jgi:hypothetical protein